MEDANIKYREQKYMHCNSLLSCRLRANVSALQLDIEFLEMFAPFVESWVFLKLLNEIRVYKCKSKSILRLRVIVKSFLSS